MECRNCLTRNVCITRKRLLLDESDWAIKIITCDPDRYAAIYSGMTKLLAENCQYYKKDPIFK